MDDEPSNNALLLIRGAGELAMDDARVKELSLSAAVESTDRSLSRSATFQEYGLLDRSKARRSRPVLDCVREQ